MKKLMLCLLVNTSLLSLSAWACGPGPVYAPNGLRIYRLIDEKLEDLYTKNLHGNVAAWNQLVGEQFSYTDVYTVVYKSSVEDMQHIRKKHALPKSLRQNGFAQSLCSRDELADFLITAKQCEHARSEMNDPWYYPSHHCPHVATLEEVVYTAKAHAEDTLLRDRYALQQMRAQISLKQYHDIVLLWENYASYLPKDNVLRALMVDYAVGAYQNVGDNTKARELAAHESDYYDNTFLLASMQSTLRDVDYEGTEPEDWEAERTRVVFSQYRKTAIAAIQHPTTHRLAEWYYTLAYIDDVLGNDASSELYLKKAEAAGGNDFIRESIHLFRIYRDAKTKPVNEAYERQMLTDLRWIEQRLVRNCPKWEEDDYVEWRIIANYSRYYWNDMLRRIGIGIYAERLMAAGRTMRAFEVLNYAENKIFLLQESDIMVDNHFGYLFQALDTHSAAETMQYIARLKQPKDELSRFLKIGSYVDYDWLYNIAGTLYMRDSRFANASEALSHLPHSYTKDSINDDPFLIDQAGRKKARTYTTRRQLAAEMARLEKQMRSASDINDRADAQVRYAIALRNMFTVVWQSVAFGWGSPWYIDSYTPNTHQRYTQAALDRSDRLLAEALSMYTDDERAAQAQMQLMNFRTVIENYPNTAAADTIRSACENYYDFGYQSSRRTNYLKWWYRDEN